MRIILLLILILSTKPTFAQEEDTIAMCSVGFNAGRWLSCFAINQSHPLEANIKFFFSQYAGIRFSYGYAYYHWQGQQYSTLSSTTVKGYCLKPGFVLCSKDKSFQFDFSYCLSRSEEHNQYTIPGPYWGNNHTTETSDSQDNQYFEIAFSQNIYAVRHIYFALGFDLAFRIFNGRGGYNQSHLVSYIPGFGISDYLLNAHLLGTINYRIL